MNKRWIWALASAVAGVLLLVCGLLVPAHLRALDIGILKKAGRGTPSVVQQGMTFVSWQNLGVAQLLLQAAEAEMIPNREQLGAALTNALQQNPDSLFWGNDASLKEIFAGDSATTNTFTSLIIRQKNRQAALDLLQASPNPAVRELLRCRELTNTVIFPPSSSYSGQAFDAVIAVGGLLLVEGRLTTTLSDQLAQLAAGANQGGSSRPIEQALIDLMLLAQRFNWDQLVAFVNRIEDTNTLHTLTASIRPGGGALPVLFTSVALSGKPAAVARYLTDFNQTAQADLSDSLRFGTGGVNELLRRNQLLYRTGYPYVLGLEWCWRWPRLAFTFKCLAYLASGFLLALALTLNRPAVSSRKRASAGRGFRLVRQSLFASGFLLVVLLLSEPFLAQDTRKEPFIFRLHVPTTGYVVPAGFLRVHPQIMNNMVLLTLLLFFVLQGLIYISCLVKLAEIRRQNVIPRMKLRLLENEDHLFDAGLYLGFAGTIVSLILVSLGIIKFSLMAAYSSTSFGIVFVCVFKIFNLRPVRRKLLIEAEASDTPTSKR
ncbi:MAG TPA: hypothetical protein VMB80_04720 [Candidatus Acidoferrum sp.]|nr:hypothetical protein [Candidatus Acidoferrum sp.]